MVVKGGAEKVLAHSKVCVEGRCTKNARLFSHLSLTHQRQLIESFRCDFFVSLPRVRWEHEGSNQYRCDDTVGTKTSVALWDTASGNRIAPNCNILATQESNINGAVVVLRSQIWDEQNGRQCDTAGGKLNG